MGITTQSMEAKEHQLHQICNGQPPASLWPGVGVGEEREREGELRSREQLRRHLRKSTCLSLVLSQGGAGGELCPSSILDQACVLMAASFQG